MRKPVRTPAESAGLGPPTNLLQESHALVSCYTLHFSHTAHLSQQPLGVSLEPNDTAIFEIHIQLPKLSMIISLNLQRNNGFFFHRWQTCCFISKAYIVLVKKKQQ